MASNRGITDGAVPIKSGNQTILISRVLPKKPFVKLVFSSFGLDEDEDPVARQPETQVFRVHPSKGSEEETNILETAAQIIKVDDVDDDGGGSLNDTVDEEHKEELDDENTETVDTIVIDSENVGDENEGVSVEEQVIKLVEENSSTRGSYIVFANGSQYIVTDHSDQAENEEQNMSMDEHEEQNISLLRNDDDNISEIPIAIKSQPSPNLITFKCEICKNNVIGQMEFFRHLKGHYETPRKVGRKGRVKIESKEIVPESAISKSEPVVKTKSGRVSKPRYDPDMVSTKILKPNVDSESGEESETEVGPDGKKTTTKEKKLKRKIIAKKIETEDGKIKYECETCQKLFANTTSLATHMLIHKGEKPLKCTECGRHFRQYSDLMYHSKSIHSDVKPHQCEYCGKEFARKYSLSIHRKVHTGVRDYKCDVCDKGFRAAIYLQEHKRTHTGERPFSCDICGHGFRLRHVLRRHVHFVHDVKNNALKNNVEKDEEEEGSELEIKQEILAEIDDEDGNTQYVTVVAQCDDDVEEGVGDGSETRLVLISDDRGEITSLNYANFQKIITK